TIAGDDIGAVTEDDADPTLTDTGTLTISDADTGENVFQTTDITASAGALGSLSITEAGEWTYNVTNADVQYLGEDDTKVETFTVLSADGTTHDVVVTITGTNDLPTISGNAVGAVLEDETDPILTDTGTLTISDADTGGNVFQTTGITASAGALGSLSITEAGEWTYNVANADVQYLALDEEKVETFTVLSADGTTHDVVVTITGTNDLPTIAGDDIGAVTEDDANPTLTDTGTLTISDADTGENVFQTTGITASAGALGSLSITEAGEWTYNVANADVQYLALDEEKVETFTVLSADGTTHDVVVTITGTNDATITTADVNQTKEDITLTVAAAQGVLSNDSDVDNILSVFSFTVEGDDTVYNAGDIASIGGKGELTLNSDGSYEFVPQADYSGTIPVVTYTSNTGSTETLTLSVTPVADAIIPNPSLIIGDEIPYTVTGDGSTTTTVNGETITTLEDGTEVVSSGTLEVSNGLGISVDGGIGSEDGNRIDVGEFITLNLVQEMQSVSMAVKNVKDDIVTIQSKGINLDIPDSNLINISGDIDIFKKDADLTQTNDLEGFDDGEVSVVLHINSDSSGDGVTDTITNVPAIVTVDAKSGSWSIVNYDTSVITGTILSTDITVNIIGTVLTSGEGILSFYSTSGMDNMTFTNTGDASADGYQIDDLDFGVGAITSHTYPIDIGAMVTDADGSETITSVVVSGFPTGSIITVVDENGVEITIEPTNGLFTLPLELLATAADGTTFVDNIYLTTLDALVAGFVPTMDITTAEIGADPAVPDAHTILGGSNDNTFTGGDGNDYIDGGLGNDVLIGGLGDDALIGGLGADTFVWLEGDSGTDHVKDFNFAEGDVLDLSDLLQLSIGDNLDDYLDFTNDGANTTIEIHGNGDPAEITQTIILDNVVLNGDDVTIINDLLTENYQGSLFIGDNIAVDSVTMEVIPDEIL
ncbi:VCBS domain-containing protein, partial [Colwelliaceae bacterium BS250]